MSKIVVIGGSGLVGSKLVAQLTAQGQQAIAASPNSGVNTITGEGLAAVLEGAQIVVDVSNAPSFEAQAVLDFFTTSTTNLIAAVRTAGVGHYVALSVVGTERLAAESPYLRAKMAQENLIREAGIAYSSVHATQFFEFLRSIADGSTVDGVVHLPPVLIQPMAADDVATAVGRVTLGEPVNGTVEVAGPEQFRLDELVGRGLTIAGDPREVVADKAARYFGAQLEERTLVPGEGALTAETRYEDWAAQHAT